MHRLTPTRQPLWRGLSPHLLLLATCCGCTPIDLTSLDCSMRRLLFEHAKAAQPSRANLPREAFDSLRLAPLCGDTPPPAAAAAPPAHPIPLAGAAVYVDPAATGSGDGSLGNPFATVAAALHSLRTKGGGGGTIVLRGGTHFLNATLGFGEGDAGTTLMNYPGEAAWLSGGRMIPRTADWAPGANGTFSLHLPEAQGDVPGLFTLEGHRRLTRARFPNADAEVAQWGYASPDRLRYSVDAGKVQRWWRPASGAPLPEFSYTDLSEAGNPTGLVKNDSDMDAYNTFGYGTGGVCDTVWEKGAPSYWCGNSSAGGWAEVDSAAVAAGQLNLPVGVTFGDDPQLARFASWGNATGAVVHAWHSQSWFTNMFEVGVHDKAARSLSFTRGGQQGGRNWCRCDQCSYAAPWCGQRQDPPQNNDTRLISGTWFVENVKEELDVATEWFFDQREQTLYLKPNGSIGGDDLVYPVLKRLVSIQGTADITIQGIGFRDAAATFMDDWAAPSGGDWSVHRGGALFVENSSNVAVRSCTFKRVDGNAVFLSRRTRNVTIDANEFVWVGDSAMATWGDSDGVDATAGDQPRHTTVSGNYIHEIGIYEKQSSGWGQSKACQTTLSNNIMFNMPRAAINFNDGLGGGNLVTKNFIWNTCRESGDHGPINSWDRMPFVTDVAEAGVRSFSPAPTVISSNYIMANYGGAQSVDNDDGSSFFHIDSNVFYSSDGFKMDYGGHDSRFTNNLVVSFPYDGQNCLNVGGFRQGHGDTYSNNTCLVGVGGRQTGSGCGDPSCFGGASTDLYHVSSQAQCDEGLVHTGDNRFFTPNGTAFVHCGSEVLMLEEAQAKYGIQPRSTAQPYPSVDTIVAWASGLLA